MRKKLIVGASLVVSISAAGIAWAALSGTISGTTLVTGIATGTGAVPCQTGPVNFTLADPSWNQAQERWSIASMTYSSFDSDCVTAGSDLGYALVRISTGGTIDDGTVTPSSSTGTITLNPELDAALVSDIRVEYLVVG